MSNSDWLEAVVIGILIGGCAVLFLWGHTDLDPTGVNRYSETAKACAEQQRRDPYFRSLVGLPPIETSTSDNRSAADQNQPEQQTDYCDLAAQESMAHSALGMDWSTRLMTALTFFALIAIIRTLHHTRRASDYAGTMASEAQKTTRAAENTVEVTRLSAEKQLRAYVFIGSAKVENVETSKRRILLSIKNWGQSPAYNMRLRNVLLWEKDPSVSSPKTVGHVDEAQIFDLGTLGPSVENYFSALPYGDEITKSVSEKTWVVAGRVDYVDAFDNARTTWFKYEGDPGVPLANGEMHISQADNHAN